MTTEPNERTVSINHERRPLLSSDPADFETWLSGSTAEAFKLARSYAAEQMRIVQSGSERMDLLAAARTTLSDPNPRRHVAEHSFAIDSPTT